MGILDRVPKGLKPKYPALRYTESPDTITVPAPVRNGFDVSVSTDAGLMVCYDGWHEHFETEEDALVYFEFGFSDRCRLKVTYRGASAYKSTVESLEGEAWVEDSTTGCCSSRSGGPAASSTSRTA